jgi:chromosomal replication initiator protein
MRIKLTMGVEMENQAAVLWRTILAEVQVMSDQISAFSFKTWFEPAELVSIDENKITIAHPNPYAITQFEKRYHKIINDILLKNGFTTPEVEYIVKKKSRKNAPVNDSSSTNTLSAVKNSIMISAHSNLNKQYVFDNYIVGKFNEMAYNVALNIAKNPGTRNNPFYIYSGVGLGKTHLIQAIGNSIEDNLKLKVQYLTLEDFMSDFLDHIRNKKTGFENRYRKVDVLIVDDIQFIAGKTSTQEAFFHTFNALHQRNKQIILSSDCLPDKIPTLTERLKSRFRMGMVVDIDLPDIETRSAIIESKAEEMGVEINHSISEYIAKNIKTNIREIEGLVKRLVSYIEMKNVEPSKELVDELLIGMRPSETKHFTARQIVNKTADFFNIKPDDILTPPPSHQFAHERHIAMYLIRTELKYSWKKTSLSVGREDHTTAMSAFRKINKNIQLDTVLNNQITSIREKLYV